MIIWQRLYCLDRVGVESKFWGSKDVNLSSADGLSGVIERAEVVYYTGL